MASPVWKVFDADKKYQASTKEVEAAAALCAFYGEGSMIKYGHSVVAFVNGRDGNAAESYDAVATIAWDRAEAHNHKWHTVTIRGCKLCAAAA